MSFSVGTVLSIVLVLQTPVMDHHLQLHQSPQVSWSAFFLSQPYMTNCISSQLSPYYRALRKGPFCTVITFGDDYPEQSIQQRASHAL